ncbi:MAG: Nre family DNA repair protein [Candidatus Bathyarchaeia archaeon]
MPHQEREPKVVRIVKKKVPWAAHLISDARVALDLNVSQELKTRVPKGSACTACKGARMLCGKSWCPIITKIYAYLKFEPLINRENIEGASPPGVFVGRIGYPFVYAGPLVPPVSGDTSLFDLPEQWFGRPIQEIVEFRLKMVRGKLRTDVREPDKCEKTLEEIQMLAMSRNSVDVEMALKTKPRKLFVLNDEVQPIGPSALIKNVKVGEVKVDQNIDRAHYDTDLRASEAILELYEKNVPVSRIQKALSVGAFGLRGQRRLVPTRWSITAVDSIVSQSLMDEIKHFPTINEFRVYESTYLDNRFEVLMTPEAWRYEAMEAWYPGTIWNPDQNNIFLFSDWEAHHGRTRYARMGGCYYAARLAVGEKLAEERRQASVLVLREAHPDYIMPVGVWQVRENVRNAMRGRHLKFNTLDGALKHIEGKLDIGLRVWIENSKLLSDGLTQTKITGFI